MIKLNGENHNHNGNGSTNSLIDELKLNKDHAAVMLNETLFLKKIGKLK